MADDDTSAGFLSRWSQRKTHVREGRVLDEPTPPPVVPEQTPTKIAPPVSVPAPAPAPAPAPTLEDTVQLTPESDFSGFMTRGVAPEVKNAAMKKLFADPHFNVMDRLDIYIDDYNQPDPLPLAMLRQMASAKTLNLVEPTADLAETTDSTNVGDKPDGPDAKLVAQSATTEHNAKIGPHTHDHADLRLQPDPAARPESAGSKPV